MHIKNTDEEYGFPARAFHWIIAVLILGLLPMGLFMGGMENSPLKFQIFALHKSFGLLVFFLGVARIVWRFVSPPPDHLETHQKWEVALAGAAHFWLYVCIIGMPMTGWLMSSAAEFPIPFFGVQLPPLMPKNPELAEIFEDAHGVIAYTLLFVLGLHVAGALKHHVLDRDETIERMAFRSKGLLLPAIIVLVVGASFSACAYFILAEGDEESAPAEKTATVPAVTLAPEERPDTSNLPRDGWAIVKGKSTLKFQATLYGAPFTGEFRDFSGSIIFNPADLAHAKADIRIGMDNVVTGDADRDTNIKGAAWFAASQYPASRFETVKFEKAGGEHDYVAVGNLTIRDTTMPVAIPFTLKIENGVASMSGKVTLNRLDYKMGTGEWEDEKTVGHAVEVMIDVTAVQ